MPAGVITVTSTVPVPAGLSGVILLSLTTVKLVVGTVPKSTAVAPVKLVPVIVTGVPPACVPVVGAYCSHRRCNGGGVGVHSRRTDVGEVPTGVITVTSTVPVVPAGLTAVMGVVVDHFDIRCAGACPKSTDRRAAEPGPGNRYRSSAGR